MRRYLLPVLLLGAPSVAAQDLALASGTELEVRADGDLNGDGVDDIAYVAGNGATRALSVLLSDREDGGVEYAVETLELETGRVNPGSLAIAGGQLTFEDLTGDNTVVASTRRFRHDGLRKRMRLIGLDATEYSRINAENGFEMTWNLVTGDAVTHELRLVEGAGEDPYEQGPARRLEYRVRPQFLSESADPGTMIEEMRQD